MAGLDIAKETFSSSPSKIELHVLINLVLIKKECIRSNVLLHNVLLC